MTALSPPFHTDFSMGSPLLCNMHRSVTIPGAPHPCWWLGRYTQEQNGHSPLSWFFKYQHSSHFITSHSFDTTKPCHDLSLPALRPWLPGSAGPQQPHERSSSLLALPPPVASAHAHQNHGPAGSNPPFPCEEVDSAHFNIMVPILQHPQENAHCLQCWSQFNGNITCSIKGLWMPLVQFN